jgi:hypothetical protein
MDLQYRDKGQPNPGWFFRSTQFSTRDSISSIASRVQSQIFGVAKLLVIDQPLHSVLSCESFCKFLALFVNSPNKVVRHTDIEHAANIAGRM